MSDLVGAPRITILVDNKANAGLLAEHGFSVWVEVAGRRLLFDTGQGPALAGNPGKLGVALHAADTLVLSHGHYDHTGGAAEVLKTDRPVTIYVNTAAFARKYMRTRSQPRLKRSLMKRSTRLFLAGMRSFHPARIDLD